MIDAAHEWTDGEIEKLQRRFADIYGQAEEDMRGRLGEFLEAYDRKNAEWLRRLASGEATRKEYDAWLRTMASDRAYLEGMVNTLANDAASADKLAIDAINDVIPHVYAENANMAAFDIEKALGYDTHSFDLYDQSTVRRLMMIDEHTQLIHEVIPIGPPRPNLQSLRVNLDAVKDVNWNRQKFTAAITQSILQGESVPLAAKRLNTVLNMDRNMATRAARTAMTSAENAGRVDSYRRAKANGIQLEQQWMATLDDRTRHSHRELDGQHVPVGEKFRVDGIEIEYPADPSVPPEYSYNCRCALVAWFPDIEQEDPERWSRLPEGMTYDEWKAKGQRRDTNG